MPGDAPLGAEPVTAVDNVSAYPVSAPLTVAPVPTPTPSDTPTDTQTATPTDTPCASPCSYLFDDFITDTVASGAWQQAGSDGSYAMGDSIVTETMASNEDGSQFYLLHAPITFGANREVIEARVEGSVLYRYGLTAGTDDATVFGPAAPFVMIEFDEDGMKLTDTSTGGWTLTRS